MSEIRRLLTAFTHPQHPGEHYQHWSRWRRHHQAQGPAVPLPAQAHEPAAGDEVLTGCASSGVSARLAEAVSPGSGTDRTTPAGLCPLASR